jgi:hypothetical protein
VREWLRFFALMWSVLAHWERTVPVPETPLDKGELRRELNQVAKRLDSIRRLRQYGMGPNILENLDEKGITFSYSNSTL